MVAVAEGDDRERMAAWTLARAAAVPLTEAHRWVRETGSCREALALLGTRALGDAGRAAERSFRRARDLGFTILSFTEPGYPLLLNEICDPPLALSVWGDLGRDDALGLAIVGSRRATAYGLRMAHRLGRDLAAAGLTVVSGLARGIDAAAHRGALEAPDGRTMAVLGSGLLSLYPREHRRLAEAIVDRGAIVSEFDLDEPPRPRNFPRRNRVITGLTLGTLVIEATAKSGSLVSARHALEQDRDVFAVPGPVTSPTSEGVHGLLRDGARLVTAAEDVLAELRPEIRSAIAARAAAAAPASVRALDPDASRLLDRLVRSDGALDVDTLVDATALPVGRVLAALTRLEVEGRVVRVDSGLYRSRI